MTHPEKLEQGSGMIRHIDRQAGVSHKARMEARRERQLSRTAGFTAIKNNRISQAVAVASTVFLSKNEQAREKDPTVPILSPERATAQAWARVAANILNGRLTSKGGYLGRRGAILDA